MSTMFRVVLTCWAYGEPKPYADSVDKMFSSLPVAQEAVGDCVKDELETLNDGRELAPVTDSDGKIVGHDYDFRADSGDHASAIRFWDGDDYQDVTHYDIFPIDSDNEVADKSSYYKYRGMYVLPNPSHERFNIESCDTVIKTTRSLSDALKFIDDFCLVFQYPERTASSLVDKIQSAESRAAAQQSQKDQSVKDFEH